jgi:hypothetical protein
MHIKAAVILDTNNDLKLKRFIQWKFNSIFGNSRFFCEVQMKPSVLTLVAFAAGQSGKPPLKQMSKGGI